MHCITEYVTCSQMITEPTASLSYTHTHTHANSHILPLTHRNSNLNTIKPVLSDHPFCEGKAAW